MCESVNLFILFSLSLYQYPSRVGLSVNLVLVVTLRTAIKDRLTFVGRSQLHRMESHFRIITLGTTFFDLQKSAKEKDSRLIHSVHYFSCFWSYSSTGSGFSHTSSSCHSLLERVCKSVSSTLRYKSIFFEN